MGALNPRFMSIAAGAVFVWFAVDAVRSGVVRLGYGRVVAERSNDPVMFWIYVSAFGIGAAVMAAAAMGLIV